MFGATSRMMMEVGEGSSRTMKVCGAAESTLINIPSVVIDMRQKLLRKMKVYV